MTRKFTPHSYTYIQEWLKDKYKNDPKFKQQSKDNASFYYMKKVLINKIDAITLDVLADCYINHIF